MPTILPGALPRAADDMQRDARLKFSGSGGEFVGLCVRGALLQLVTFGFYRFWLATDIRRHLWSNSSIDGEPLEYTGRGRELLIGFLIALAVLVPVQLLYVFLGIQAELLRAFLSFPLVLFYTLFGQFAVYRARRYRLTRTIWRGVRFWMTGSGWNYAFRWLGWGLLALLTLGLAYPWMRASLERYKLENTLYGDLKGGFVGKASEFFKRGIGFWLFAILPVLTAAAGGIMTGGLKEIGLSIFEPDAQSQAALVGGVLMGISGLWLFTVPFAWPFFRALEWRWWAEGVRFGALSLASDLRGGSLLKIYIKMFFMGLLVLCGMAVAVVAAVVVLALVLGVEATSFSMRGDFSPAQIAIFIVVIIGYLAVLLAIGIVQRFYLTREMWRVVSSSITVSRLEAADGVAARGEAVNALGEGLADGLDVAGL